MIFHLYIHYSLLVTGVPPVVTSTWSSHLDVSHNERILLNCSANGVPPPSYWWKKDGEILHEATGAEYVIPAVHLANGGEYVCLAQNRFGNTTVKTVVRGQRHDVMSLFYEI